MNGNKLNHLIRVAEAHGLQPEWLAGVLKVESNFGLNMGPRYEPHLGTHSYGWGQVLPSTALWMIREGYVDPDVARKVYSAFGQSMVDGTAPITFTLNEFEVGVELAAAYLEYQMRRYGDIEQAVAAYNAGSARYDEQGNYKNQWHVDKWNRAVEEWMADASG